MSTVAIIGRMLLALVVVLGIMWFLARWARKPLNGKSDRVMSVLARQQLSRTSSVTVLRVMDRALVLGVTEQGIRLITETELPALEEVLAAEPELSKSWLRARSLNAADQPGSDTGRPAAEGASRKPARVPAGDLHPTRAGRGALEGSVLSPKVWRQVVTVARDLTVRR